MCGCLPNFCLLSMILCQPRLSWDMIGLHFVAIFCTVILRYACHCASGRWRRILLFLQLVPLDVCSHQSLIHASCVAPLGGTILGALALIHDRPLLACASLSPNIQGRPEKTQLLIFTALLWLEVSVQALWPHKMMHIAYDIICLKMLFMHHSSLAHDIICLKTLFIHHFNPNHKQTLNMMQLINIGHKIPAYRIPQPHKMIFVWFVCNHAGWMETKSCAKPAMWKYARRYFYWALRARITHSSLLKQIEDGNPETKSEERAMLLDSLIFLTCILTIVLWPKSLSSSTTSRQPCRHLRLIIYLATWLLLVTLLLVLKCRTVVLIVPILCIRSPKEEGKKA